jgi:hypothetical protein
MKSGLSWPEFIWFLGGGLVSWTSTGEMYVRSSERPRCHVIATHIQDIHSSGRTCRAMNLCSLWRSISWWMERTLRPIPSLGSWNNCPCAVG